MSVSMAHEDSDIIQIRKFYVAVDIRKGIEDAVARLTANGERVTYQNIAKIIGCSTKTVARRFRTENSDLVVNMLDKRVSDAVVNLTLEGKAVTMAAVAAAAGRPVNVIKKRLSRIASQQPDRTAA